MTGRTGAYRYLAALYEKLKLPEKSAQQASALADRQDDPASAYLVQRFWILNPSVAYEVSRVHVHGGDQKNEQSNLPQRRLERVELDGYAASVRNDPTGLKASVVVLPADHQREVGCRFVSYARGLVGRLRRFPLLSCRCQFFVDADQFGAAAGWRARGLGSRPRGGRPVPILGGSLR